MIKIIGISGSPRKAATEYSLKESLNAVASIPDIEIETILLRDHELNHCIHCDLCIKKESKFCLVHSENNKEIYKKFFEADGYLIASPVYSMSINAQLASFINLMRPTWNILKKNPAYFWSKVGAAIAVGGTRHGGQELTLNTIHGFYHTYGIEVIGGAHTYNGGTIWSKDNKEKGAKEDIEGIKTVRAIGQRLGLAAYLNKYGKEMYLSLLKEIEFV